MEGNKASSSGQAVYKCGLCSKEYYHYRDLAMHERIHLNQMGMARHLQGRTLPSYDTATSSYNSGSTSSTTLESFEKLTQPFHSPRESQIRLQNEQRTVNNQSSPIPQQHPIPEQEKLQAPYRVEADNRNTLPARSPIPDNRNVAMDSRPQSVGPRPLPLDSRHVQSPDPRGISHTAVRPMPYTSQQYIDNVGNMLYSDVNSRQPQTSTLDVYSTPTISQSADYFPVDGRNHPLPKLGSQMFGKVDSYYPPDKSHYSHIPEKTHDVYTSSQYGMSKLLGQAQETYYPHPSPALAKFNPNKMTSHPMSTYYTQQTLPSEALFKHDVRPTGPKSTLYYGPQETTTSSASTSSIPYQMAVSKPHELANTYVREPVNKLPERPIANRPFPTGHVSPHMPYSDLYKGSHLQPQVLPPLTSQISPSHMDYNAYKPAAEPVPSVNLHLDGNHLLRQFPLEYTCHVCQLPCSNSHELSEHMKIHAMAQSSSISHYIPQTNNNGSPFTVPTSSSNNQEMSTSRTSSEELLLQQDKSHVNMEQHKYHCKSCDKVFTDSAKYIRHEAHHRKSDFLLHCEFCMASFKNKGNYLHHMTQNHGPPHAATNVVEGGGGLPQSANEETDGGSKLLVNPVNIVDCQICDLEVYRNKLVEHLATHPLFRCRICEGMFVQNSELVEHLMKQHPRELQQVDNSRNRSSDSSRPGHVAAGPVQRAKLEEEDSGLEEDKEDDTRESINKLLPRQQHPGLDDARAAMNKLVPRQQHQGQEDARETANMDIHRQQNKDQEKTRETVNKDVQKQPNSQEEPSESENKVMLIQQSKSQNNTSQTTEIELTKTKEFVTYTDETKSAEVEKIGSKQLDKPKQSMNEISTEKQLEVKSNQQSATIKVTKLLEGKKAKMTEMKNLKENIQKKVENIKSASGNKQQVKNDISSVKSNSDLMKESGNDTEVKQKKLKFSCSKCDKSFAKHGDLVQHVEVHNKDPSRIYCEVCDLSYHIKEKGYYMYHMKYHKDSEMVNSSHPAELTCVVCHKDIKKQVFISHIVNQHTQFSCDICQWSYSSESSLVTHMKRIHNSKYLKGKKNALQIKQPPPVYRKLKDIKAVEKAEQSKESEKGADKKTTKKAEEPDKLFHCEICKKAFKTKYYYEKHVLNHSLPAKSQQISCDFCELVFAVKGTYLFHVLKDHSKSAVSESQGQSELHIKSDENIESYPQSKTENDYENKESLSMLSKSEPVESSVTKLENKKDTVKQVMKTVLNPETGLFEDKLVDEQDDDLKGEEISKDNKDLRMKFVDHQNEPNELQGKADDLDDKVQENEDKIQNEVKLQENENKVVKCAMCNKSMDKFDLLDHMRTHTFFHCDICKFTYTKKTPYTNHMKLLHVSEFIKEKISTIEQEAVKKGKENDKAEEKEISPSGKRRKIEVNKLISCPLCPGEFRQQSYAQHLKSHLPQALLCQFCQRQFSKPTLLGTHEKSHERICHSDLPYPLYCPTCNMPLKTRKDYVSHMCLHLRKTPFQCKSCPETFLNEKIALSHIRTHHDPNCRLIHKLDGEAMKFDIKTNRITRMLSEYLTEIKEMNDFFKYNGKPEIWISSPTRKSSSSDSSDSDSDSDDDDDDNATDDEDNEEKPNLDTSDGDYIPKSSKSVRYKSDSDTSDSDSDSDSDDSSSDESDSDDSDSGSGKDESHNIKMETSRPSRPKRRRTIAAVGEPKISEEEEIPRNTRTQRKSTQSESKKETNTRRKSTGMIAKRKSPRTKLEEKAKQSTCKEKAAVKRKAEDTPGSQRVLRAKQMKTTTPKSDKNPEEVTPKSSTKCPRCPQKFSSERNLNNHMRSAHTTSRHKREKQLSGRLNSTPATVRLKTRTRNLRSDLEEPCLSSTPIRAKAVIKISPIRMDTSETKIVRNERASSGNKAKSPSPNKESRYTCKLCKKNFHNNKWNYIQHIRKQQKCSKDRNGVKAGKKDLNNDSKGNGDQNKPFSCKSCTESFKKKRDLYIHAKIHSSAANEEGGDGVINSEESFSNSLQETSTSLMSSDSKMDISSVNMSQGDTSQDSKSDKVNIETRDNGRAKRRSVTMFEKEQSSAANEHGTEISNNKSDKNKKSENVQTNKKLRSEKNVETPETVVSDVKSSVKPGSEQHDAVDTGSKSDKEGDDYNVNNNSDVNNKEDNDSEDRSKLARNLPVTKMTAATALSKWRSKVQSTLSSQLELHATKLKELQANPEAAKMKDYLSKSGKPEKQNLECRICGDLFDSEDQFREHMDVHLNQSPPYCSLCNMYFMAIYPIRRLMEHNRKKHPELVKT